MYQPQPFALRSKDEARRIAVGTIHRIIFTFARDEVALRPHDSTGYLIARSHEFDVAGLLGRCQLVSAANAHEARRIAASVAPSADNLCARVLAAMPSRSHLKRPISHAGRPPIQFATAPDITPGATALLGLVS
jgi:hypothetical protein